MKIIYLQINKENTLLSTPNITQAKKNSDVLINFENIILSKTHQSDTRAITGSPISYD